MGVQPVMPAGRLSAQETPLRIWASAAAGKRCVDKDPGPLRAA